MAYADKYPNGYKNGYSSTDDPERKDNSPYGLERAKREVSSENKVNSLKPTENTEESYTVRSYREAGERTARTEAEYEAIKIMVKEAEEKYKSKSPLTRAFKKFNKSEALDNAQERVGRMTPEQIARYVEGHGGKSR